MSELTRDTGTGESFHTFHGASSIRSAHAAKVAENRLTASQGRYVFSAGIIILLLYSIFSRFSNYINYYYVKELFLKVTLMPDEADIIRGYIQTFKKLQLFLVFIPAIIVDNYIRKEWVFYAMISVGAFGSIILCRLADVSAQYAYFKNFAYKEDLFVAFIGFQSLNEFSRPIFITLVMDQIVNLNDFAAESSKIFSVFCLGKQFCRLGAFTLAVYTSTSKTAAAKGLIIPPILNLIAIITLIALSNSKYPFVSYSPRYNGLFKLTGSFLQRAGEYVAKNVCRCRHYKKNLMCRYSERTHEESKRFNNFLLLLICFVMHFYSINVVSEGSFTQKILSDNLQETAIQKVYGQCMILAFLIFSQFVLFPLMYRTKLRRIVLSPLRCMIASYAIVWVCGVVTFVILCLSQRLEPGLFHSLTSRDVSFYNMLNDTVEIELLNSHGGDTEIIGSYGKHSIVMDNYDDFLKIGIRNKRILLDEYHEVSLNQSTRFLITVFGLEQIIIPPLVVGKYRGSLIIIVCMMVVCRGNVKIDCDDQNNVVELHKFVELLPVRVNKDIRCKLLYQNGWVPDTEEQGMQITITDPVYYVAVSEDMQQEVSLQQITKEPQLIINLWTMLPIDLVCSWANMVFEVSFYQFVFIEAPQSVRTIVIAIAFTSQTAASLLSQKYLLVNNLISERNGMIAFGIHFLFFVWFLTRMSSFNTARRVKELYDREAETQMHYLESSKLMESKQKTSIASGDTMRSSRIDNTLTSSQVLK